MPVLDMAGLLHQLRWVMIRLCIVQVGRVLVDRFMIQKTDKRVVSAGHYEQSSLT
jgi:hypothetical protein